jgi:apolipoprotein N-acyltransferase
MQPGHPYRGPTPPADEHEAEAIRRLSQRVVATRSKVGAAALLVGLVVAGVLFVWLRALLAERWGVHAPRLTMLLTFLPTLGAAFALARRLERRLLRARMDGWIVRAALEWGVPEGRLRLVAQIWTA